MGRRGYQVLAAILLLAAVAWTAEVLRQVHAADGDGPPIAALALGSISIALLAGAGWAWQAARGR